jgi:uncharacterized coiled-coil protein SlyX
MNEQAVKTVVKKKAPTQGERIAKLEHLVAYQAEIISSCRAELRDTDKRIDNFIDDVRKTIGEPDDFAMKNPEASITDRFAKLANSLRKASDAARSENDKRTSEISQIHDNFKIIMQQMQSLKSWRRDVKAMLAQKKPWWKFWGK